MANICTERAKSSPAEAVAETYQPQDRLSVNHGSNFSVVCDAGAKRKQKAKKKDEKSKFRSVHYYRKKRSGENKSPAAAATHRLGGGEGEGSLEICDNLRLLAPPSALPAIATRRGGGVRWPLWPDYARIRSSLRVNDAPPRSAERNQGTAASADRPNADSTQSLLPSSADTSPLPTAWEVHYEYDDEYEREEAMTLLIRVNQRLRERLAVLEAAATYPPNPTRPFEAAGETTTTATTPSSVLRSEVRVEPWHMTTRRNLNDDIEREISELVTENEALRRLLAGRAIGVAEVTMDETLSGGAMIAARDHDCDEKKVYSTRLLWAAFVLGAVATAVFFGFRQALRRFPEIVVSEISLKEKICADLPGTCADLTTLGTPQMKALDWVDSDSQLQSYPEWRRIQRYALGVVALSLNSSAELSIMQDAGNDECDWAWSSFASTKVICDSSGMVTHIDNHKTQGDTGTKLPRDVAFFRHSLEYLSLCCAGLTGTIPTEYGMLSNLKWLGLDDNSLVGPIPSHLGRLSKIEVITLGGNNLTGTVPDTLCPLWNRSLLWLMVDCTKEIHCDCCSPCT